MGSLSSGFGGAAENLEKNWDRDRQSKRDIMKAKVIHDFNMEGRTFTADREDLRAGTANDQRMEAARLAQKQGMEAANLSNRQANARQDRRIANAPSETMNDAEGKVWERRPGGGTLTPTMTQTGPTQYEGGDDQALTDPEFGVSPGLLSGMQNKGKREQLNTGRPESAADKHMRALELQKAKEKGAEEGSGSGSGGSGKGSSYQKKYREMLRLGVPSNVARGVAYGTIKTIKDEYGYTSAMVDLASGTTIGTISQEGVYTENPEWAKQSKLSGGGQAPATDIDKSKWTADWAGGKFDQMSWTRKNGKMFTMSDILKQARKKGHTPERFMRNIGIDPKALLTEK
jgi:hypothetical protein